MVVGISTLENLSKGSKRFLLTTAASVVRFEENKFTQQTIYKGRENMSKAAKVFAMTILVLGAFSQPAISRDFPDIYTECGIGAMLAPKNPAFASVSNFTWDYGTTAISSNISSPDTCKGGEAKVASFIYDSYEPLEKDLASGNGTFLDTLMVLAGVDPQSKQQFTDASSSYTDQSRFEKAETLYSLVYKHVGAISQS